MHSLQDIRVVALFLDPIDTYREDKNGGEKI